MHLKSLVKNAFAKAGYTLSQNSPLLFKGEELTKLYETAPWIRVWMNLSPEQRDIVLPYLNHSKSQLGQDIFALAHTLRNRQTKHGFFVEIGASDGVRFSNTWLMEKHLGWQGILAEPAKSRHLELKRNRTCHIDTRAVFEETGILMNFLDIDSKSGYAELSGLKDYSLNDDRGSIRNEMATHYDVSTVSLNDLFATYNAPPYINFLSIDTEGSELQVLNSVDLNQYSFDVICIEHNFNKIIQDKIYKLLSKAGYTRVHQESSAWDDWYTKDQ
jgi:FkbM family methyltransferase